tara:strand:+ start:13445 stop:13636 length:192 start_codon:yes stop_codon:yes gene_type:complete
MIKKRLLPGLILLFLGFILTIISGANITGAVVGLPAAEFGSLIGVIIILGGVTLFAIGTMEES